MVQCVTLIHQPGSMNHKLINILSGPITACHWLVEPEDQYPVLFTWMVWTWSKLDGGAFKGTSGGPKCTIPVPMEAHNLWSHVIDIPLRWSDYIRRATLISILCKNYAKNPMRDIILITLEQEKNPELKLIYWKMANIDGISVEQLNLKTFWFQTLPCKVIE